MLTSDIFTIKLRSVSEPFDAGLHVELKFDVSSSSGEEGELYLRVRPAEAYKYQTSEVLAGQFVRVSCPVTT
jgi:hypothetical protein